VTAGEVIALVAAVGAVVAAGFAGWQARSARRSAQEASRGADAAEAQADAVREQVELMRAAHERDLAREAEDVEASKAAAVAMWKETRQPRGGSGAAVVVHNAGPAIAEDLVVEVRATGDGGSINVLANGDHRVVVRPELRAGERWLIPLMRDAGQQRMPIEFSLQWRDRRGGTHDVRSRVEALGSDQID
jgi:hypothetical protein